MWVIGLKKRLVLTIFLIAILSVSFLQIGPISAHQEFFTWDDSDSDDTYDFDSNSDIKIIHDEEGSGYSDIGYADVDYSTNTESNSLNRYFFGDSVDIYFDGESTTVSGNFNSDINEELSTEILNYVSNNVYNSTTDVDTMREDIREICHRYGSIDCTVNIDSIIGEDQIPFIVGAEGESMLPTIQNGQYVLVNKTHDIHVGDIVSVDSKEYGGIMKRVDEIDGDNVHLVSDNKNVYYKTIDGVTYEYKGITTWVDISEIEGVAIYY